MEGMISQSGLLYIKRGALIQEQHCPHSREHLHCGDWCPLFREPEVPEGSSVTMLKICNNTILYFNKFRDQRPASTTNP